jgi:hypothetical protein
MIGNGNKGMKMMKVSHKHYRKHRGHIEFDSDSSCTWKYTSKGPVQVCDDDDDDDDD